MTPGLALTDVGDGAGINLVMNCKASACQWTGADSNHIGFGHLCPEGSFAPRHPALPGGILHIVGIGSDEEMLRVDASWNVAAMADDKPLRQFANIDPILEGGGKAMGGSSVVIVAKSPVAPASKSTLPQPTVSRLAHVNPRPEHGNPLYRRQQPSSHIGASL